MPSSATAPFAVLWDMDGTLVDSAADHWEAWVESLALEGYQLTRDNFAAFFGRRNDDILRGYFGPGLPLEEIDRISLAKETRFRARIRERGIQTIPGALPLIRGLAEAGWLQAIASSAPRANVTAVLEILGITGCFGAIVAGEDVAVSKPDPAVFLLAAERLEVAPSRCVVAEDAPAGVEGARRAGMRSVAVCRLHADLPGDLCVTSFDAVTAEVLERLVTTQPAGGRQR